MNRVLIYGSTYLTQICISRLLKSRYNPVAFVPSIDPYRKGNINLPKYVNQEYDILISIQYDRKIEKPGYNLHTGILPEYGGLNILKHTLDENSLEQGLTFHKMTTRFDYGPIISKITYPVFDTDQISDLYRRQLLIAPNFLISCLNLVSNLKDSHIGTCPSYKPRLLRRD